MQYLQKVFPIGTVSENGGRIEDERRIEISNSDTITAIGLSSSRPDMLQARGRIRLEISGEVIFEDRYPAKMIMVGGNNTAPNDRIFSRMGEMPVGNGQMTVRYQDYDNAAVPFEEYEVDIILEYRLKK